MYQNKDFKTTYDNILNFNKLLHKYIIKTSELNKFDSQVAIYQDYDMNLRNIIIDFKKCYTDNKLKSEEICISKLKNDFENLRSKTSIRIESDKNN